MTQFCHNMVPKKSRDAEKDIPFFPKVGQRQPKIHSNIFLCAYVFVIIFTIHIWMCIALSYHNPREWGDKGMINHNKNYFFIFLVFLVALILLLLLLFFNLKVYVTHLHKFYFCVGFIRFSCFILPKTSRLWFCFFIFVFYVYWFIT